MPAPARYKKSTVRWAAIYLWKAIRDAGHCLLP